MTVREVCAIIEELAPCAYQEGYDNSGLLIGDSGMEVSGVLVALDLTESVLDEAIAKRRNLILTHHPIIFKGLKKLCGDTLVERCVIKAIQQGIAVYAAHTNMDAVREGVNSAFVERLALQDVQILQPVKGQLLKLVTFVPQAHLVQVREALFKAGAGTIGAYDACSFSVSGYGTFRAGEGTQAYVGEVGKLHREQEERLEVLVPLFLKKAVVAALLDVHPYEEVAYDIFVLENEHPHVGAGLLGSLAKPMALPTFLDLLKEKFQVEVIRYNEAKQFMIERVAVCGGSGNFLIPEALKKQADIFVSAEFKYHDFIDVDGRMVLADIGHFEGEQFVRNIFVELLTKKITKFACSIAETSVNPVKYY